MIEEDQPGVPVEHMRQVLEEHRAIVRSLSPDADQHHRGGSSTARPDRQQQVQSPAELISLYHQVLDVVAIMRVTSDRRAEDAKYDTDQDPKDGTSEGQPGEC